MSVYAAEPDTTARERRGAAAGASAIGRGGIRPAQWRPAPPAVRHTLYLNHRATGYERADLNALHRPPFSIRVAPRPVLFVTTPRQSSA